MPTAIIYCRVSSKDQLENYSLDNQEKICLDFAKRNNIEVIKIFIEEGESAKTSNRTQLIKALEYCRKKKGKIDYFLFYKLDRFSRDVGDAGALEAQLAKYGIEIKSATESFDLKTSVGKFTKNMIMATAQFDNDLRSERTIEGMKRGFEDGKWIWPVSVGFKHLKGKDIKGEVIIDSKKAPLVRRIFMEFSKGVYSQNDMVNLANRIGLQTLFGKKFTNQTIGKMLRNIAYIGIFKCKYGEMELPKVALIPEKIFYQCQQVLDSRKRLDKNTYNMQKIFPLKHFVLCGFCGRPLTAHKTKNRHNKLYYYYRCYYRECASKQPLNKKKLEDAFMGYLQKITPKEDFLGLLKEVLCDIWKQEYVKLNKDYSSLAKKLDDLKEQKISLIDDRRLFDEDDFMASLNRIKHRIEQVKIDMSEIDLREFDIDEAVDYCFKFVKDIPEYWHQVSFDTKLQVQNLIFPEKLVYLDGKFKTPKLSLIFDKKLALAKDKESLVALT